MKLDVHRAYSIKKKTKCNIYSYSARRVNCINIFFNEGARPKLIIKKQIKIKFKITNTINLFTHLIIFQS